MWESPAGFHFPRYEKPGDTLSILPEALPMVGRAEASSQHLTGYAMMRSPYEAAFWWLAYAAVIALIALLLALDTASFGPNWMAIGVWSAFVIGPVGYIWTRLTLAGWRRFRFGRPGLTLPLTGLYPGMRLCAEFELPVKARGRGRWTAHLVCGEMIGYPKLGWSDAKYYYRSLARQKVLFAGEMGTGTLSVKQDRVRCEIPIEVPAEAVASLRAGKCAIEWRLEVTVQAEPFGEETSTFPLWVRPMLTLTLDHEAVPLGSAVTGRLCWRPEGDKSLADVEVWLCWQTATLLGWQQEHRHRLEEQPYSVWRPATEGPLSPGEYPFRLALPADAPRSYSGEVFEVSWRVCASGGSLGPFSSRVEAGFEAIARAAEDHRQEDLS